MPGSRAVMAKPSVAGFAPSDISGLKLWLKADAISASDGDPLATWADSSGNGNDATQSDAAAKPAYKTNIVNGKPVVRFVTDDGTAAYQNMTFAGNPLSGASAGTVLFVVKLVADPPAQDHQTGPAISKFGNTGVSDHLPYSDGTIYYGFGSTSRKTVGNPAASLAAWRIYACISAASDWRFYIDGGAAFYSTGSNTVDWGSAPGIGNAAGPYTLNGDFAEACAYDSALSLTDLNRVADHLATKYGLTWTTAT